jgi:hypothetical protein
MAMKDKLKTLSVQALFIGRAIAEKAIMFGLKARELGERKYKNVHSYVQSEKFEQHLDAFAKHSGIVFDPSQQAGFTATDRGIRISAKVNSVLAYCASEMTKVGEKSFALGKTFGPRGTAAAVAVLGSAKAVHFFMVALNVAKTTSEVEVRFKIKKAA